jgi:NADPH:quinone reductase-like Zn-dependent oxidoreductase
VEDEMSETSRRKFLAAAGIGAAGTVGLTGGQLAPASAGATVATRSNTSAREPVVAFVEHHFSDRVHLLVGEREIVVHDEDLAARILNAAGGR